MAGKSREQFYIVISWLYQLLICYRLPEPEAQVPDAYDDDDSYLYGVVSNESSHFLFA